MKITLLGAAGGEVTGSSYLLQTATANESGHILGSASLEVTVEEGGRKEVVVFSGDLGPRGAPLHRDPVPFQHADLVFVESTYGDRDHPSLAETALLEGARSVRIAGRRVEARATTHLFGGLSAHAGQSDLLAWIGSLAPSRPRVFLTHGEDGPRAALRSQIMEQFGLDAESPAYRQTIEH